MVYSTKGVCVLFCLFIGFFFFFVVVFVRNHLSASFGCCVFL